MRPATVEQPVANELRQAKHFHTEAVILPRLAVAFSHASNDQYNSQVPNGSIRVGGGA